jgi:predicted amidohydrolase YtcJ
MKTMVPVITLLFAMLTPAPAQTPSLVPDLIIVNAAVRTMDDGQPTAEAVAVSGNRIVAVGASAELRKLAGSKTRLVDAGGRSVLPGFNDAHVHWLTGGFSITNVNLREARSPEEFARLVGEFAKPLPQGRWILEGSWDHENWPGTPLPTRELIDALTPELPVFVNRLDGHLALAYRVALKLAGVTMDTKDVPGGQMVRDAWGEPTGLL